MVNRTSVRDASRRAQTHASRATLRELNSKPYWAEAKQLDIMANETATDVEYAEGYGATGVPAKQDPEDDDQQGGESSQASVGGGPGGEGGTQGAQGKQPKGDAAEAIVIYLNGSRSHPVIISIGDRRHRLVELEEGDYALHRLKDDRQQVLLHKEGTFLSTRNDKVMRIALVPKPQDDQQQQDQGRGGGAQQGGKKKKSYGQKTAKPDNEKSDVYIDQRAAVTDVGHQEAHAAVRGSDASTFHGDRKRSTQATNQHSHLRTMENRIFTDEQGCWSETPIQVKKDRYCKD